jgi:hypothetical protein
MDEDNDELSEAEYVHDLMDAVGLDEASTIGELIAALENDEGGTDA